MGTFTINVQGVNYTHNPTTGIYTNIMSLNETYNTTNKYRKITTRSLFRDVLQKGQIVASPYYNINGVVFDKIAFFINNADSELSKDLLEAIVIYNTNTEEYEPIEFTAIDSSTEAILYDKDIILDHLFIDTTKVTEIQEASTLTDVQLFNNTFINLHYKTYDSNSVSDETNSLDDVSTLKIRHYMRYPYQDTSFNEEYNIVTEVVRLSNSFTSMGGDLVIPLETIMIGGYDATGYPVIAQDIFTTINNSLPLEDGISMNYSGVVVPDASNIIVPGTIEHSMYNMYSYNNTRNPAGELRFRGFGISKYRTFIGSKTFIFVTKVQGSNSAGSTSLPARFVVREHVHPFNQTTIIT